MINNYTNFLIERELKHWEKLQQSLNEGNSWGELKERIFSYLDEAAKKGDDAIIKVAKKIFDFFKKNPKMLILVIGILVAKYNFSKNQIIGMVPDSDIVSAEEIYTKAMAGRGLPEDWEEETGDDSEEKTTVEYSKPHRSMSGNFKKFLDAIADKESTNDPEKVNDLGYMGKYQFGQIALKDILQKKSGESDEEYNSRIKGYWPKNFGKVKSESDFNFFKSKFLNKGVNFWPEHKQDMAMQQLLKNNLGYLGDYVDKWVGKTKKGIKITKSGLLAGAHLLGPSNVKKFLDEGEVAKDANGTPITEYIQKFGGYNIGI
jgi:hypothetical protein